MEGRNYITPIALNPRQNLPQLIRPSPPPHFIIGDNINSTAVHHREMQALLIDNQRLAAVHVSLSHALSAARQELRHLSAAAVEVKAERDAQVREVYDKAAKMEADIKSIDESNAELAEMLCELRKLRAEKTELDEKLNKLRDDVAEVSEEWKQFPVMKSEIETMQKEIERGREIIEHEIKVYNSNIKQTQSMENYKILMAAQVKQLHVEAADAGKRARAAAAAEAASIPGTLQGE